MKKLLVLIAVLVFSTAAMAGTVSVVVEQPGDGEYNPSDIVKIDLVANGYPAGPGTAVGKLVIDAITAPEGGTAEAVGTLHPALAVGIVDAGDLVNANGDLITGILGGVQLGGATVPDGATLYSFEFHVPDLPYSTIITIDIRGLAISNAFNQPLVADVLPAEIHIVPEPMTIALLGLGGLFLRRRK